MVETLLEAVIGFVSGVASGLFGIGGGMITIPLLRLALDVPALTAAATPLAAIVPTAVAGGITHYRAGNVDLRTAVVVGLSGAVSAVFAARSTELVGGTVVMVTLAAVIVAAGVNMLLGARRTRASAGDAGDEMGAPSDVVPRPSLVRTILIGLVAGAASGFLGIGGGFIMVPLFVSLLDESIKRAIGTSLAAIPLIATPALITHATLGHIDWGLALTLAVGSSLGAIVGARSSVGREEGTLRTWFALLMIVTALVLVAGEFGWF